MKPYFERDGITIYHSKWEKVRAALAYDCVLSDPPWGTDTATDSKRFSPTNSPWWSELDRSKVKTHKAVRGDKKEFDPRPWIDRPAILWGANHFTRHLPHSGGWLVWDKRRGVEDLAEKGWPLSEAELAWTNVRGSTRVFRNLWCGLLRSDEKGEHHHPTQRPVALMAWCLTFLPAGVVLDPYMGSGPIVLAARQANRPAIGIEEDEEYCEIAARRLDQGLLELEA